MDAKAGKSLKINEGLLIYRKNGWTGGLSLS